MSFWLQNSDNCSCSVCSDVDPAGQNGILNESQWVTLTVVNILFALLFLLLGIFMFLTVALRVHPECVILRFLCLSNTHTVCAVNRLKVWMRAFNVFVGFSCGGFVLVVLLAALIDPVNLFTWCAKFPGHVSFTHHSRCLCRAGRSRF